MLDYSILQNLNDADLKNLNNYFFIHIPKELGSHKYNLSDSKHIWNYLDVKKDKWLKMHDNYNVISHLEENNSI